MIFPRSAWKPVPWKNGGGVTNEIYRDGPADDFVVRFSVAEVAADGPFSRFPGVDRIIMGLAGPGFRLIRNDDTVVLVDSPHEPFCFMGEDEWRCQLLGGPSLDFNVMTNRAKARAALTVHYVQGGTPLAVPDRGFLFPLDGGAQVGEKRLERWDLIEFGAETTVAPLTGPVRVALISISPRAGGT